MKIIIETSEKVTTQDLEVFASVLDRAILRMQESATEFGKEDCPIEEAHLEPFIDEGLPTIKVTAIAWSN